MVSNNAEKGFHKVYHSNNNLKPDTKYTPSILQLYTKYTPSILLTAIKVYANTPVKVTPGHIQMKS